MSEMNDTPVDGTLDATGLNCPEPVMMLHQHIRDLARQDALVRGLRLYVEHDNRQALATYSALGMQDAGYRMLEDALPWVAGVVRRD